MAAPTFSITALVLKRTKLGESDVIVTLLAEDGSQYKAVAKGARKPTSSFASRLEVYSIAQVLLAQGKNLDIVKEARLVNGFNKIRSDFFLTAAAAPIVELLAKTTFQDQPNLKIFKLTEKALDHLEYDGTKPLIITCAHLLKCLAFLGFRPSFLECIDCGTQLDLASGGRTAFSFYDGGVVCASCSRSHEVTLFDSSLIAWCNVLLYATFDQIDSLDIPDSIIKSTLQLLNEWSHVHLGINLRSITYLFKNVL